MILAALVSLSLISGVVQADQMKSIAAAPAPVRLKPTLSFEHYMGFSESVDPSSVLAADLLAEVGERNSFRVYQSVTKLYYLDQVGGREWNLADTLIYHSVQLSDDFFGTDLRWRTGLTLPLSSKSQDNSQITVLSGRLGVTKKFLKERLTVAYRPEGYYYFNTYKQSLGGIPLRHYGLRNGLYLSYKMSEVLSVTATGGLSTFVREKGAFSTRTEPNDGTYDFDIYANYEFKKDLLAARVGYTKSDNQIRDGRFEINLHDEQVNQYYAGLDIMF